MPDFGNIQSTMQAAPGMGAGSGGGRPPGKEPSLDLQPPQELARLARSLWSQFDEREASPERISRALALLPELCSVLDDTVRELSELRAKADRDRRFVSHEVRKRVHLANLALYRWGHLDDEERTSEESDRLLDALTRALEQLPRVVDDLWCDEDEDSEAPARKRPRPIRQVVEEILTETHPLAAERKVRLDAVGPLPEAPIDSGSLEVVLLNLVHNALSHLDHEKPERWAQVAVEAEDGGWCFSVLDNGVGIPEELQERVFEERVQGDGDHSGDGLGLTLARRLVEDNGGRIWLESREGDGTVVRFFWPSQEI